MEKLDLNLFKKQLSGCLNENILPYWIEKMTDKRGGYYGKRDGSDRLFADAPKGTILQARILWSFSSAYRATGKTEYLDAANHAKRFIIDYMIDREYGGVYWSVSPQGEIHDDKKQFYAIAFVIYGLTEYSLATGDNESLILAYQLYECIEKYARDRDKGGYIEAMTREWQTIDDMRLSEHDENASKTMNTHLHILEAYANLLRLLKELSDKSIPGKETRYSEIGLTLSEMKASVAESTKELIHIFFDRIENPDTHHLTLFFDNDWRKYDDTISFGHDIEASWLILEATEVTEDKSLYKSALAHTKKIAYAGLEGRRADGSMIYELHPDGRFDYDRHWWVQAENVVGQLYLSLFHSLPGSKEREQYLYDAFKSWQYIESNLMAPAGEWYWSRKSDGHINNDDDKAGFWKCPYHNSRMCIEGMRVLNLIAENV